MGRLGGMVAALALAGLAVSATAHAAPTRLRALTPVSGKTPFGPCPFELPPPVNDREWQPPDTALEPAIAVDPNDPRRMATAWMQDFTSVVVGSSSDGGRTWRQSVPPNLGKCSGSEGATADPRLSFGPDGVLYLSTMRHIVLNPGRTTPDDEVAVSSSRDGGQTWSQPTTVQVRDAYNDYPSIAADPEVAGRVYVSYTRATEPFGNSLATMFAVSEDGGRTFSRPRAIHSPRLGHYMNGRLLAQPGGRLLILLWMHDQLNDVPAVNARIPSRLTVLGSRDGGVTWDEPHVIAHQSPRTAARDPESGESLHSGRATVAAEPGGGWWVAWHDVEGASARMNLVRGRPDGTWEEPRELLPWGPRQIFFPMVSVTARGKVGVVWLDSRKDRPDDGRYLLDGWFRESRDGGRSFGPERHLVGPMDLRTSWTDARTVNGDGPRFIGDYLGIAARGEGFVAALPLTQPYNQVGHSQLFVADIGKAAGRAKKKRRAGKAKRRSPRKRRP